MPSRIWIHTALHAALTGLVLTAIAGWSPAQAQSRPAANVVQCAAPWSGGHMSAPRRSDGGYFVEFRSRPGQLTGHILVFYGKLTRHGRRIAVHCAGLFPTSGRLGLMIGLFIPVPATLKLTDQDRTTASNGTYYRRISSARYERLRQMLREPRATYEYWHVVLNNCNAFAAKAARAVGLLAPDPYQAPPDFIRELRALNSE